MTLRISLSEDGEGESFFFDDFRKFFVQLSNSQAGGNKMRSMLLVACYWLLVAGLWLLVPGW
jgi:hypothetical protein